MPRILRLLTLSLAVTATATGAALGSTALAGTASPLAAGPSSYGAHEVAAPSPLPVATRAPSPKRVAPAAVRVAPKATAAPRRTHRAVAVVTSSPAPRPVALTKQQQLDRAIAKLPGFHPGDATFVLKPGLGNWGLTDMGNAIVYISPTVPARRMYDVVAHEWGHVVSAKPYLPDAMAAVHAMAAYFGGSGMTGAERAADCIARVLGATWTNYTPCNDAHWRAGARTLLAGHAL